MIVPPFTYRADYNRGRQVGTIEKFSRGSSATFINRLGDIGGVTLNQPRINFDPVTLECKGLLSEPSSTNLVGFSEFPNGTSDASMSGGVSVVNMDGFAKGIQFTYTGSDSLTYKSYSPIIGSLYCLSVFVEMDDGLAPSFGNYGRGPSTDFALILFGGVSSVPSVEHMGGKLYRVWGFRNGTTDGAPATAIGVAKYAGNSTRGFKVSGYQLEQANAPSSYIRTTSAAQATRFADILNVPQENLPLVSNQGEGTLVFRGITGLGANQPECMLVLHDGVQNNNYIHLQQRADRSVLFHAALNGTVTVYQEVAASLPVGQRFSIAFSFKAGQWLVAINGTALPALTAATVPSYSQLGVGNYLGASVWRGHIRGWEIHGRAMSMAELQDITR